MIRRFKPEDYAQIASWYEARGRRAPSPDTLSDIGYIVDNRVAGWLYTTNANLAMIEGVISNPETVPSLRRESLRRLVGLLIDTALTLGYDNIFGLGKHPSMSKEAKVFGFIETDYKLWTLVTDKQIEAKLPKQKGLADYDPF